jgi:hypothetical protein
VTPDHTSLKEVAIFLTQAQVLPADSALGLYISVGNEWQVSFSRTPLACLPDLSLILSSTKYVILCSLIAHRSLPSGEAMSATATHPRCFPCNGQRYPAGASPAQAALSSWVCQ